MNSPFPNEDSRPSLDNYRENLSPAESAAIEHLITEALDQIQAGNYEQAASLLTASPDTRKTPYSVGLFGAQINELTPRNVRRAIQEMVRDSSIRYDTGRIMSTTIKPPKSFNRETATEQEQELANALRAAPAFLLLQRWFEAYHQGTKDSYSNIGALFSGAPAVTDFLGALSEKKIPLPQFLPLTEEARDFASKLHGCQKKEDVIAIREKLSALSPGSTFVLGRHEFPKLRESEFNASIISSKHLTVSKLNDELYRVIDGTEEKPSTNGTFYKLPGNQAWKKLDEPTYLPSGTKLRLTRWVEVELP